MRSIRKIFRFWARCLSIINFLIGNKIRLISQSDQLQNRQEKPRTSKGLMLITIVWLLNKKMHWFWLWLNGEKSTKIRNTNNGSYQMLSKRSTFWQNAFLKLIDFYKTNLSSIVSSKFYPTRSLFRWSDRNRSSNSVKGKNKF